MRTASAVALAVCFEPRPARIVANTTSPSADNALNKYGWNAFAAGSNANAFIASRSITATIDFFKLIFASSSPLSPARQCSLSSPCAVCNMLAPGVTINRRTARSVGNRAFSILFLCPVYHQFAQLFTVKAQPKNDRDTIAKRWAFN